MPTVTLKKGGPRRLNIRGHIFEREQPLPVDIGVASALRGDDRFRVEVPAGVTLPAAPAAPAEPAAPTGKAAKMQAILAAIDELDEDNEAHWTNDGKPDARALTSILGYQVTSAERNEAMKIAASDNPPAPAGNVRVVRRGKKTGDEAAPVVETPSDDAEGQVIV